MFSLQKLFGKDDPFFRLLEESAREAQNSVQALKRILQNASMTPTLDEFVVSRRKDKAITNEISELLVKTFVTALEREDIESLSRSLYKIPKTIEKFAERYILCAPQLRDISFDDYLGMLDQVTSTLYEMVHGLRKKSDLESIKEFNATLQKIEGDADKLMLDRLRDLYSGKHDPVKAVILKDLYELLEKVFDRCRDAGNVVFNIVLKHS